MTVSHCWQILESTIGHPATWNDKTLILYESLIESVKDGTLMKDYVFELYEKDSNNNIVQNIYNGAWFMVDKGYLSWSCTIPPYKDGVSYNHIPFSEWLESMRKDVDCTFGILKGRFSVLRTGLRLQDIDKCDEIWLTCCALHNRLLFIDELHKNWKGYAPLNWEKDQSHTNYTTPFALSRLNAPSPEDVLTDSNELPDNINSLDLSKYEIDGFCIVSMLP